MDTTKVIKGIKIISFSHFARKILRKPNIFYPLIRIRTCAYRGVRIVRFSEIFAHVLNDMLALQSCETVHQRKIYVFSFSSPIIFWNLVGNKKLDNRICFSLTQSKKIRIWVFITALKMVEKTLLVLLIRPCCPWRDRHVKKS